MTLRIIFTLAILAGLAAAPAAQTFRWQAGHDDVSARIDRTVERALAQAERAVERARLNAERSSVRATRLAELQADRITRDVQRSIDARVRAQVRSQIRTYSRPSVYTYRSGSRGMGFARDLQQDFSSNPCSDNNWGHDDYEQHCEVRDETIGVGPLTVDAGQNGGISVIGWDRNEIKVQAIVRTNARTEARAKELAAEVRLLAGNGKVSATGPDTTRREWWSVSYRINVPHKNDLDLNANNGGVTISAVSGNIKFDTTNGGVKLSDLGGSVRGQTRNGGLTVNLAGQKWDGEGIDVETSNGGVTLAIPDGYNAQLETRTVNGGFRTDYPITITGELSSRRGISTTLGSGGPPVRVRTTNGGLKIGRR